MSTIDKIKKPIIKEMSDFESHFRESIKSKVPLLGLITNYILRRKGKQMRPMLVFLSAKLITGETNNKTFVAASLIELLHTATLVHDDVVDESYERRGLFSINALWKNKISVLVGDYFLAKGLLLAVDNNAYNILKIVSESVKNMSEGELLQIEKSRKLNITEDIYYEIISKKTATLIASCTACGASSVDASDIEIDNIKKLGTNIGMAFQLKDDLLDYQSKYNIGKPTGNDIQEKKLTLPLIYALSQVENSEKKEILKIVKAQKKSQQDINKVINFASKNGGIEYTEIIMNKYKNNALKILSEFKNSDSKESITELINYTTSRKK